MGKKDLIEKKRQDIAALIDRAKTGILKLKIE
jgi:hypothetical protein